MLFALLIPQLSYSQVRPNQELRFEVNRIQPFITITKADLSKAQTLVDINLYYEPSWVRRYLSVEVTATYKGRTQKVTAPNNHLTEEQKALFAKADIGTEIFIRVTYIPENTLPSNEAKETSFSFIPDPEQQASFVGGEQALLQYLKVDAINQIPYRDFEESALAAVKFTINETGAIVNPSLAESSKNANIDQILLDAIRTMPTWKPATYSDGTTVKQEFVLTVGNLGSCVINLLGTRKLDR